jgi:hypothetical protein
MAARREGVDVPTGNGWRYRIVLVCNGSVMRETDWRPVGSLQHETVSWDAFGYARAGIDARVEFSHPEHPWPL